MFRDRLDAARRLAELLQRYRGARPLVLGIPRGAAPMARLIAAELEGDLDVVLVHKIGAPHQEELAVGAVDDSGHAVILSHAFDTGAGREYLAEEIAKQLGILQARRAAYGAARAPIDPAGRTVIVVDDGVATGATMEAAIRVLRSRGAARVIVAAGVIPRDTAERLRLLADEVVAAAEPIYMGSVGEFFQEFTQLTDEEVVRALQPE
jgi:putative phosphoribosyl transferase